MSQESDCISVVKDAIMGLGGLDVIVSNAVSMILCTSLRPSLLGSGADIPRVIHASRHSLTSRLLQLKIGKSAILRMWWPSLF